MLALRSRPPGFSAPGYKVWRGSAAVARSTGPGLAWCSGLPGPMAPATKRGMNENPRRTGHHAQLRRLDRVWVDDPVFFITTCVLGRKPLLTSGGAHAILREVWETGGRLHGWQVGSYVIMPDHVHLFCAPNRDAASLSVFVGGWKEWSSKFMRRRLGVMDFQWQPEFFDHVLRPESSYAEKWDYVRNNPVRAGLVDDADAWHYAGHVHFR